MSTTKTPPPPSSEASSSGNKEEQEEKKQEKEKDDEANTTLARHIHTRFAKKFLDESNTSSDDNDGVGSSSSSDITNNNNNNNNTNFQGVDAYWTLSGISRIQLPTIFEWNNYMRKAYSVIYWIRPRLIDIKSSGGGGSGVDVDGVVSNLQGCLYKFAHDSNSSGVIVYSNSEWWQQKDDTSTIQTEITALCSTSVLQLPLELKLNEWNLVCLCHVFPYLKKPQLTVTVNGQIMGTGELEYPNNLHVANDNVVLQNMSCNGVVVLQQKENTSTTTAGAAADTSSSSGTTTKASSSSTKPQTTTTLRKSLAVDVASFALYPVSISQTILAILYEAGPCSVINGRVLPLIPPVANWNKGSSIEAGPKVGIPLIVNTVAPEIQQLATTVLLCFDAVHTVRLDNWTTGSSSMDNKAGTTTTTTTVASRRFIGPMIAQAGYGEKSPRVGLMQPGPPVRFEESATGGDANVISPASSSSGGADHGPPQCYITGNVDFRHALLDYCHENGLDVFAQQEQEQQQHHQPSFNEYTSTLYWSVVMEEHALHYTILPFFLSLCPPGKFVESHDELYKYSVERLYALYSNGGQLAAEAINTLSRWIEHGGSRVAEAVLQNGYIHILSNCLRTSLLRAQRGKFFTDSPKSSADWLRRFIRTVDESTILPNNNSSSSLSPKYIPSSVVDACARLISACCGPSTADNTTASSTSSSGSSSSTTSAADSTANAMTPNSTPTWVVIRRTSDLALTALFALALDIDLWSANAQAASTIYKAVADRYSGCGYIMRSQISVQYFLDCTVKRQLQYDLSVGDHLTRILSGMLLASLSNKRSISQGEHDIAACVGALSDCPLSSLGAHVVLNSLANILEWCEVLPPETTGSAISVPHDKMDEQGKMQVASRLGRNMLICQFHDVVAPMVLSRTVFSGESNLVTQQQKQKQQQDDDDNNNNNKNNNGDASTSTTTNNGLYWESHWRLSLLLFSWVASIAGPEGLLAAKSTGSLLLASAFAGSLTGAMDDADPDMVTALYMPPPGMALMIGSSIRSEWSYTDLIADRLQIMMPLFPGLVVSLITPSKTIISKQSLTVLANILSSVGSAFHKVFGGIIHLTEGQQRSSIKNQRDGSAESVKAAKSFVPPLITVAVLLERFITATQCAQQEEDNAATVVGIYKPEVAREKLKNIDLDSWVDVPTSTNESAISELSVTIPGEDLNGDDSSSYRLAVSQVLQSCQRTVLNTTSGLLSNAMNLGGAGAAIALWNSVLVALEESALYSNADASQAAREDSLKESEDETQRVNDKPLEGQAEKTALVVLCRLCSIVLIKSLKRHDQWEVLSYELSSAVAKLCQLIEERELLKTPLESNVDGSPRLSDDQIVLLSAILEILSYGRDCTGWCQLALPAMSGSSTQSKGGKPSSDLSAASKLLLPVLQSCLRIVLSSVVSISSYIKVEHLGHQEADESNPHPLLELTLNELDLTLTAAIVGLSFSGARDLALGAMATFRSAISHHQEVGDDEAVAGYKALIHKVAEELRVRYEGERRLRENALFDAYDDDQPDSKNKEAIEGANVVERLILGGDEVSFDQQQQSDDFVLFHEPSTASSQSDKSSRLGYTEYIGLGAALEECRILMGAAESNEEDDPMEKVLATLGNYLDSWDLAAQMEEKESEVIELFGSDKTSLEDTTKETKILQPLPIPGSETAADTMSAFFEFAAAEKSRMKELCHRFLPGHRHSCMSYSERFCWARFMEVTSMDTDKLWERGMPDGNRDVRSRLPTLPCCPQFRRYIPKYLDHYAAEEPVPDADHRKSVVLEELDAFTKTLLESGKLEIVDITKKEAAPEEDDEPDILIRPATGSVDEDDFTDTTEVRNTTMSHHDKKGKESEDRNEKTGEEPLADDALPSEDFVASQADESSSMLINDIAAKGQHSITTSAFSTPPDNASSSLSLLHSAAAGMIEQHMDNCLHVKAAGSRACTMLLTATHLVLEYEGDPEAPEGFYEGEVLYAKEDADRQRMIKEAGEYKEGPEEVYQQKLDRRHREVAGCRPKSIRWNLSEVSHVYLRRYRLRDSALEIFFIPTGGAAFGGYGLFSPSTSLFLDLGPGYEGNRRRDDAAFAIMHRVPQQAIKQWPDRSAQFLHDQLSRITLGWVEGRITNFDYLLHLNMLSGRSYNDVCQYPVFPWVLGDYTSEEVPDLTDRNNYRDLSKPVGALNPRRLADFIDRFETFADPSIPPFMYGSHYSTSAGVVLHFLVRLHPFAGLHRQLQSGHFDVADRLFSSVPRTWSMCTGTSAAEVKELTPEWYCNPTFLKNVNGFKLGTSQDGEVLRDVELPPWAKNSPEKFVEVLRCALESDVCSEMLPDWIDLIFGRSQQGPEAIKANNVFFYLTYYGSVDVASIEDEALRQATELQIAHFGQCPMQVFKRPHVRRLSRSHHKLSFYQLLSTYSQKMVPAQGETVTPSPLKASMIFGEPAFLPFFSAPLSHWVHLDAPPPGPHAALIAVRFAGTDRCLAVDQKGIFHTFRWAWRPEEESPDSIAEAGNFDKGCFVAQRELARFRSVPRLMHTQLSGQLPAVAISKTLFAGRSVLLVLSDGDGHGGLGMQLVDPSKGQIRGEVLVPAVHAGRITCIATDPIGTAAGHGGVGGELALFGSLDGSASLWRFMSSHYLPLRPRVRLRGHEGEKVSAVALSSATYVAVTVSANKCCFYSIGNGSMIRCFGPPKDAIELPSGDETKVITKFADTPAVAISVQGFVITACESLMKPKDGNSRTVVTLHLFTMEGVSLGSKPLEGWRGLPHKMYCTPDGTAVMVCCGRGITIHRLSAWMPLEIIDEWQITEADSLGSVGSMEEAFDIDLGPSLNRPVVASAGCSNGVLRLHALPGISSWSERHKTSGLSQTVGSALAKPAQRLNQAVRDGLGIGRQIAGMGRDIGREVTSDVKERGVGGLFRNFIARKNSTDGKNENT